MLLTVLYGTGIEVSVALRLTRADVWDTSQEINAAGTKTHTRHRVASVADWAWPLLPRLRAAAAPGGAALSGELDRGRA